MAAPKAAAVSVHLVRLLRGRHDVRLGGGYLIVTVSYIPEKMGWQFYTNRTRFARKPTIAKTITV
jgi:hypothetical protein